MWRSLFGARKAAAEPAAADGDAAASTLDDSTASGDDAAPAALSDVDQANYDNLPAHLKEQLPEKHGSIIKHVLKQLKPGMDLSRVTLPTFILEPRSFLERVSDFMINGDLFNAVPTFDDPVDRLIALFKWYISGWHIRPVGAKKPYNPLLGEVFRASWSYGDGSSSGASAGAESNSAGAESNSAGAESHSASAESDSAGAESHSASAESNSAGSRRRSSSGSGEAQPPSTTTLIAEQVSHHPPVSAFYFSNPTLGLAIDGYIHTRSKFLGNSAACVMEGESQVHVLKHNERYTMNLPTVFVRGIVVGTVLMETGGDCQISCAQTGLQIDIRFKTKGLIGGTYNAITAKLRRGKEVLVEFDGHWDDVVYMRLPHSKDRVEFFNVKSCHYGRMDVAPLEEQGVWESRRVWDNVTKAMYKRDLDEATRYKTELEDAQRARTSLYKKLAKARQQQQQHHHHHGLHHHHGHQDGHEHRTKLFSSTEHDQHHRHWVANSTCVPGTHPLAVDGALPAGARFMSYEQAACYLNGDADLLHPLDETIEPAASRFAAELAAQPPLQREPGAPARAPADADRRSS